MEEVLEEPKVNSVEGVNDPERGREPKALSSAEGVDETPQTMIQDNEVEQKMEPNPIWSETSTNSSARKFGGRGVLIALVVLLLAAAVAGGGYFWYRHHVAEQASGSETGSAGQLTEEPTPTAAPTPSVNRREWTIDVLNGTATAGLAKKVADELKALGYQVGKVGNADKKDYKTSELHVSSTNKVKALDTLPDFKTYGVTEAAGDLPKTASMSAKLIIGVNYATPTPTSRGE